METGEGLESMEERVWKTRKQRNKRQPVEGALNRGLQFLSSTVEEGQGDWEPLGIN